MLNCFSIDSLGWLLLGVEFHIAIQIVDGHYNTVALYRTTVMNHNLTFVWHWYKQLLFGQFKLTQSCQQARWHVMGNVFKRYMSRLFLVKAFESLKYCDRGGYTK